LPPELPQRTKPAEGAVETGKWIAVGVVRGAFGVQGALKIEPYTDIESTVLNRVRRWRMDRPGGAEPRAAPLPKRLVQLPFALPAAVDVNSTKNHGGFVIATIAPATTREQALALKGVEILVGRTDFPATGPDEYYWADLIGCQVVDPSGNALGIVEALDDHGAQSVLRLDNRILIPFVSTFILEVAPEQKRIVADWSTDWL
jgi:16S rRNA processing protein RimM